MFRKKKNNLGFTLVEMLLVVAITAVLLSISMVGLAAHSKQLKMTELDNTAKEIYMAAQNRAILLSANNKLDGYVKNESQKLITTIKVGDKDFQSKTYFIDSDDSRINKLIPKSSVESSVWDGKFYVVYEPESGSVTDVFFFKGDDLPEVPMTAAARAGSDSSEDPIPEGKFNNEYYNRLRTLAKDSRMKLDPMVGYYGGDFADGKKIETLDSPIIEIKNEDDLEIKAVYKIKRPILAAVGEEGKTKFSLDTKFTYNDDSESTVSKSYRIGTSSEVSSEASAEYFEYTVTTRVASLTENKKIKDFFKKEYTTYGEDFSIEAKISYSGTDMKLNSSKLTAVCNSLFGDGTDVENGIANISCTRHLQNLDKDYSKVDDGITKAVQTGNIVSPENYNFMPIKNDKLISYSGSGKAIKSLNIVPRQNGSVGYEGGLFAEIKGENGNNKTLDGIHLVNTVIQGKGNMIVAGALAGRAEYVGITKSYVYWENSEDESLKELLGDDATEIKYQITSTNQYSTLGGMVGTATNVTIVESGAATLLKGSSVGGLVGTAKNVTINKSYASSYLKGDENQNGYIGGLAAMVSEKIGITNSYAAGFIDYKNGDNAAGFIAWEANATQKTIENSYSAVRFVPNGDGNFNQTSAYHIASKANNDTINRVYYLNAELKRNNGIQEVGTPLEYEELTDKTAWGKKLSEFAEIAPGKSHPYNLQTKLSLSTYNYPAIPNVDHYGDWIAKFQSNELVYYEVYKGEGVIPLDNTYGFSGANVNTLAEKDKTVLKDGYAIAIVTNVESGKRPTIEYEADGIDEEEVNYADKDAEYYDTVFIDVDGDEQKCTLLVLPDDYVNIEAGPKNSFYSNIKATIKSGGVSLEKEFWYNPHFASTVSAAEVNENTSQTITIRTARHFNMLSKYYSDYYGKSNWTFQQDYDVDAGTYTGYKLFTENKTCVQEPIGTASKPFAAKYLGNAHVIKNFGFTTSSNKIPYKYIGLFGYNKGTLKDVVYIQGSAKISGFSLNEDHHSLTSVYAGGLVGINDGTISNSAVSGIDLSGHSYNYKPIYAGGLVGINRGIINNSSADIKNLTMQATLADAYVGGFVGVNESGAYISKSYAVGELHAAQERQGTVDMSGFAAVNKGGITNSYSANNLSRISGAVSIYGFQNGTGTAANCYFLNGGNFTYNANNYTAQYVDSKATGISWTNLQDDQKTAPLGMKFNAAIYDSADEVYPYPSSVVTKIGTPIHYGLYPKIMSLGTAGVYYWEKMETRDVKPNGEYDVLSTSYHISAMTYDRDTGVPMNYSTLSEAHNDNGVVTDYGYGYYLDSTVNENDIVYNKEASGNEIGITTKNLYFVFNEKRKKDGASADITFNPQTNAQNDNANDAFTELLSGKYKFYSWNTYDPEAKQGLYATQYAVRFAGSNGPHVTPSAMIGLSVPGNNGNLKPNGNLDRVNYDFYLDPFFADSLAPAVEYVWQTTTTTPTEKNKAYVEKPIQTNQLGKSKETPYKVRSVRQLQFINWNNWDRNFNRAHTDTDNITPLQLKNGNTVDKIMCSHYVYLDEGNVSRNLHWKQTHDIDGSYVDANKKLQFFNFTPIAAIHDETTLGYGDAYFWFGGTYDGQDYAIKEINIDNWGSKYNTAGIFGFARNAKITNVVMHSPSGKAVISAGNYKDASKKERLSSGNGGTWYAMGGLVGLAANDKVIDDNSITNCSVSGYTIKDEHSRFTWGGGSIGGLVGVSNMKLSNCSAVNDIIVDFTFETNNANIRVGGLVGSCQQSVEKSYTGGSVTFGDNYKNIGEKIYARVHIGGICGGYFFLKELRCRDFDKNIVRTILSAASPNEGGDVYVSEYVHPLYKNCYTYLDIEQIPIRNPAIPTNPAGGSGDHQYPSHIYAISGLGSYARYGTDVNKNNKFAAKNNVVWYENCYVLKSCRKAEPSNIYFPEFVAQKSLQGQNEVVGVYECSYEDLAEGGKYYNLFVYGIKEGNSYKPNTSLGFYKLTTESVTGENIDGRFSFGTAGKLTGRNYPFPTILTQKSELAKDGIAHIHYGDWPLQGIERPNGTLPINIDLFADYKAGDGAVVTEKLGVENADEGGIWSVTNPASGIVNAEISNEGELKVTAKKAGSDIITVTYTVSNAEGGKEEYTLNIKVNVTATLNLVSNSVIRTFNGTITKTQLVLKDKNGGEISDELKGKIKMGDISVNNKPEESGITSAEIDNKTLSMSIGVRSSASATDETIILNANYSFTYEQEEYGKTQPITQPIMLVIDELEVTNSNIENGIEFRFDDSEADTEKTHTISENDFTIQSGGNRFTAKISNVTVNNVDSNITVSTDIGNGDKVQIKVAKPAESITVNDGQIKLTIQFTDGGYEYTLEQIVNMSVVYSKTQPTV